MKRKIRLSALVSLLVAGVTFTAAFHTTRSGNLLKSDGIAYFLYARSIVVDRDTDVTEDSEQAFRRFNPATTSALEEWGTYLEPTGTFVLPWPIGMGVIMAPFYALGWAVENLVAAAAGREPDSFGVIPQIFTAASALVFGLAGFWLTVRCCREVTRRGATLADPESTAFRATLVVSLGGPAVFYVFFHPMMAHAFSFACAALYTLVWWRAWSEGVDRRRGFLLGALLGLATLVRYQSAMFGVMLMGLVPREVRRQPLRAALGTGLATLAGLCIPLSLQVVHLLAVQGLLVNPETASVASSLKNPVEFAPLRAVEVLFSCNQGAFYWAPALGVGFFALLALAVREGWARVFVATILAHALLIGSLEGEANRLPPGAPGMRYLTECSILLAVGVTGLMCHLRGRIRTWVWVALGLLALWHMGVIAAFVLHTIPNSGCVTWAEMARGMADLLPGWRIRP